MKSPRQHYAAAEVLMARVDDMDALLPIARALTAQAMVHATLATVEPGRIPPEPLDKPTTGIETLTPVGESL